MGRANGRCGQMGKEDIMLSCFTQRGSETPVSMVIMCCAREKQGKGEIEKKNNRGNHFVWRRSDMNVRVYASGGSGG
jgi:hypothetical protein